MRTPHLRLINTGLLVLALGCGNPGNSGTPDMTMPPAALPVCTAALPSTAKASAIDATVTNAGVCVETSTELKALKDGDLTLPAGYVALGGAIQFTGPAGLKSPHGIDFVIPCDVSKAPAGAPTSRVVVVEKRVDGNVVITPVANVLVEDYHARLHFHNDELGTYQCAIPTTAGKSVQRHYTYRALIGPSMGGFGSSINFWNHTDRYDAIAVMGADPGPDVSYMLGRFIVEFFFGGFCTAEDEAAGKGKIGENCPLKTQALADQYELTSEFNRMLTQQGNGVGLTLRRKLYVRAFRDLARAFGNGAYATVRNGAQSSYVPPGVSPSTVFLSNADACANPTVLKNFFDRRYNPTGAFDVITFCDGGDSKVNGVYEPTDPQTDPTQIMLAVDVNGDGKRQPGEPVLVQTGEPFRDVGKDGLADADEPGYSAATNPDPNHDNYHYLHNPGGTERNWRWDAGEPFDDFGVDGVKDKGCEVGSAAGCYDFGEKNGKFDYNPNVAYWYAHDPRSLIDKATDGSLDRLDVYYDAGIRDFLNAQVATNTLMGGLHARGQHVRIFEGFPSLVGLGHGDEMKFEINRVDFGRVGRHAYVRYGDPDASPSEIESNGDGRHVGTVLQAAHRAQMLFYFVGHAWPDGDTDVSDLSGNDQIDDMFTAANGRVTPYTVMLPPGYGAGNKKYPVVYALHGYGMDPKGIAQIGIIAHSAMANDNVGPDRRLQKFIIVGVDAMCRPGGEVANAPLSTMGDLCEEGGFYSNHPDGTYLGETHMIELQALIESRYRVKAPEDRMVIQ